VTVQRVRRRLQIFRLTYLLMFMAVALKCSLLAFLIPKGCMNSDTKITHDMTSHITGEQEQCGLHNAACIVCVKSHC